MKVRIKANKLENAEVAFVSLVQRGANRVPFKIVKQEKNPMIDLSRILKGPKKADPSIVGIAILKTDFTDKVKKALSDTGLKVDAVEEFEDGTILLKQDDTVIKDNKEVVAVRLDSDFVALCKGFDPYSITDGMSFGDILKSQGFMPGFSMATDALYTTVRQSLVSAKDQKDAVNKIKAAIDEFGGYMASLAGEIPESAFKALEAFRKEKGENTTGAAGAESSIGSDSATGNKDKKKPMHSDQGGKPSACNDGDADSVTKEQQIEYLSKLPGADAAVVAKMPEADLKAKYVEAKKAEVQKAEADAKAKKDAEDKVKKEAEDKAKKDAEDKAKGDPTLAAIAKMGETFTSALNTAIAGVTATVKELGGKVDAATKAAEDAKALATKTAKAVDSTLVTDAGDDDDRTQVGKAEGSLGCIDTAFQTGIRKSTSYADRMGYTRRLNG